MHGTGTVTESQLFQQTKTRLLQGWTQQFYARDHDGLKVPPCAATAVSWCLRGAMMRAFYDLTGYEAHLLSIDNPLRIPLSNVRDAVQWVVEELIGRPDVVTANDELLVHPQEAVAVVERADRQFHAI